MSLEYAIEYPCQMRKIHGEQGLRLLARTSALISKMVRESITGPGAPSPESVEFTTRYAEELERAEAIGEYCRTQCQVHVSARISGLEPETSPETIECLGRIRYPIQAEFERFLAERLQQIHAKESCWPNLLRILLDRESPFDGEATKELRRITTPDGLRFYELRLPIPLSGMGLTTDHIFDILAGFTATDGGAAGYQREIPPVALNDYADFLESVLIEGLDGAEVERLRSQGGTWWEYMRFAAALRSADDLGVRMLLD